MAYKQTAKAATTVRKIAREACRDNGCCAATFDAVADRIARMNLAFVIVAARDLGCDLSKLRTRKQMALAIAARLAEQAGIPPAWVGPFVPVLVA